MPNFASELRLLIQPGAVSFAREYTRAISALAQLPSLDSDMFVDAVTAACSDIIGGTESRGDGLILRGVVTPSAVSLTIREQGKPFDPSVADATGTGSPVKCCDWSRSVTRWMRPTVQPRQRRDGTQALEAVSPDSYR